MLKQTPLLSLDTGLKAVHTIAMDQSTGKVALGTYYSGEIVVIDQITGEVIEQAHCRTGTILSLFFAAGALYCLSKNFQELGAYLEDPTSGKKVKLLQGDNYTSAACAYPQKVALPTGNQIVVLDQQTGQIIGHLNGHTDAIGPLAFDLQGSLLASSSADRTVRLWDVVGFKCLTVFKLREPGGVALSPDGHLLAIGGPEGRINVWHLEEENPPVFISIESDAVVRAVCFDDQGELLCAASWDGKLSIWKVKN